MSDNEKSTRHSLSSEDAKPYYTNPLYEDGRYLGYNKKDPFNALMAYAQEQNAAQHSITTVTEKDATPKDRGAFNERWSDFGQKDPLDELMSKTEPAPQPKPKAQQAPQADPKELLRIESTKREIDRLGRLYCDKRYVFEKESRTRWILTFCGFTLVNFIIVMLVVGNLSIADVLETSLKEIGLSLLLALVITGIHFFINVSIFGWLFQKDISGGRQVDDVVRKIRELEKTIGIK